MREIVIAVLATALALVGCSAPSKRPLDVESATTKFETETETGIVDGARIVVSPMRGIENGVYYFRNIYSTLILEIRDGQYSYWSSSDGITEYPPAYPLRGRYIANGPQIHLEHRQPHLQDQWTFRRLNGKVTLWRPSAVTRWHSQRKLDDYGVLYPTKLEPEEIWRRDYLESIP